MELMSARFIFMRHDAHRLPLQPPYDGQFWVFQWGPKGFVLDMGGHRERVTLDRLKHMVADEVVFPFQVPFTVALLPGSQGCLHRPSALVASLLWTVVCFLIDLHSRFHLLLQLLDDTAVMADWRSLQ